MKIGFGDSVEQKSYANRQAMALRGEKPWLGTADLGGYGNLGGCGKKKARDAPADVTRLGF